MEALAFGAAEREQAEVPFSPSGTSATEPMLGLSGPNRKSRCVSRTWPQRGLPVASSASKERMLASSAGSLRRNGSSSALASAGDRRGQHQHGMKRVEVFAQAGFE